MESVTIRHFGLEFLIFSFLFLFTLAEDLELLILHTNDIHSSFEETPNSKSGKQIGGCARIANIVRSARKAGQDGTGPQALYFDVGDIYTGSIWFTVHKHRICVDIMNALKPDAMCLGNHEFDFGIQGLLPFLSNVTFPIVTSNFKYNQEKELEKLVKKSTILEIKGRKIGVVGYLTPDTRLFANLDTLEILDEVEVLNEVCDKLVKDGINIIIALGHSGHKIDQKVARNVKHVDLVIGGHTDTFLWNGPKPDKEIPEGPYPVVVTQESGKRVPVVQAYTRTKYLGKLTVRFDDKGNLKSFSGNPVFVDNPIPQEKDILDILEKYRSDLAELNTTLVGRSKVYLEGGRPCRLKECNFGNLITDSYVRYRAIRYNNSIDWTDASIALINAGAIRNSINASRREHNVYKADIIAALPFQMLMFMITLKGNDLLRTLEIGARSTGETSRGEFLVTSGLRVEYDFDKPPFARVKSVQVLCSACEIPAFDSLDLHASYRLITTKFLIGGGDGHNAIKDNHSELIPLDVMDVDIIYEYFKEMTTVMSKLDGRTLLKSASSNVRYARSICVLILPCISFYCNR